MKSKGKIIVVSAPSGCGKSTIIKKLLADGDINLGFSVSATNRPPREGEIDGVHYNFLSTEEFRKAIDDGKFVEWEEVYPGRLYGTLKSEIDTKTDKGENLILDIDVAGALNVKKLYPDRAMTLFIEPPSIKVLEERLRSRGTDTEENILTRLGKAVYEISFADKFDHIIVNDDLNVAVEDTRSLVEDFLNRQTC